MVRGNNSTGRTVSCEETSYQGLVVVVVGVVAAQRITPPYSREVAEVIRDKTHYHSSS